MHCRLSPAVDPKTVVAPAWFALNFHPAAARRSCKLPSSAHWRIKSDLSQVQARYFRTLEDQVCSHSSSSGNRDSSLLLLPALSLWSQIQNFWNRMQFVSPYIQMYPSQQNDRWSNYITYLSGARSLIGPGPACCRADPASALQPRSKWHSPGPSSLLSCNNPGKLQWLKKSFQHFITPLMLGNVVNT